MVAAVVAVAVVAPTLRCLLGGAPVEALAAAAVVVLVTINRTCLAYPDVVHVARLLYHTLEFEHGQQTADFSDGHAGTPPNIINVYWFMVKLPQKFRFTIIVDRPNEYGMFEAL